MSTFVVVILLRCGTNAFGLNWPVQDTTTVQQVFTTYGEFTNSSYYEPPVISTEIQFHAGVDIAASSGTTVFATMGGYVVDIDTPTADWPYNTITVSMGADDSQAIGYVHVDLGINPLTGSQWVCGDTVTINVPLGAVESSTVVFSHVHLEFDSNGDGFNCDSGGYLNGALEPAPAGDPLEALYPTSFPTPPVISTVIFRWGDQEGYPDPAYFSNDILWGHVDIVAQEYQQFAGYANPLGVHSTAFSVSGSSSIPRQTLITFEGAFISTPNAGAQFHSADLTTVIYEYDSSGTIQSHQDLEPPPLGLDSSFYYILTNQDFAPSLDVAAKWRYWNTLLSTGSGGNWNDLAASTNTAVYPGALVFPDGQYTVSVYADDDGGNETTASANIVLSNFRMFLATGTIYTPFNNIDWQKSWLYDGEEYEGAPPSPDTPLNGGTYTIALNFSGPVSTATLSIDGGIGDLPLTSDEPVGAQQDFTATLDVDMSVAQGTHTMTVDAWDWAGNEILSISSTTDSIDPATDLARDPSGNLLGTGGVDASEIFTVDTVTPTITAYKNSIDSDLLIVNGSSTNADAIAFVVNDATPSSGLDRAVLTELTDGLWSSTVTFGGGSTATATISFGDEPDEPLQLQVYDLAGNVASLGFFLDRTPPEVAISTPGNGSSYGPGTPAFNQVPINGVASDSESGIAYVLLTYLGPYDYWNGSTWYNDYTQLTVAVSTTGIWSLDNSGTGFGPEPGTWDYTVTAQAVDGAGNYSSTAAVTFSYTVEPPAISLYVTWGQYINPQNAQDQRIEPLSGTLNVATAQCPDGSTATLTGVTINGGAVSSQGPFLVPWNFTYSYAFDHQGGYPFTPDALGVCDGVLTSFNFGIGTLSFVYDDQKPMVAISSPDFTQTVTQSSGTASDNIGLFGVFAGAVDQTAGKYWTGTSWASGTALQYLQAVGSTMSS